MSRKRRTLETGAGGGGGGYSLFYKDETANLEPKNEVLFYQTWGFREPESPAPEVYEASWDSLDYDKRWDLTVKLYPSALDDPRSCPLPWPKLEIALWWWNWAKVS